MNPVNKQPNERITLAFEFRDKLPNGIELSSGTVSAINVADSSDVTATLILSPTLTIAGTRALFTLIAGTDGAKYKVTGLIRLTNADIVEEDVLLAVGAI